MDVTYFISHSACLGSPVQHEARKHTCEVGGEEGRKERRKEGDESEEGTA